MATGTTVVVGIDGGNFELVDKWIGSGDLPNIERVVSEGIRADLQSVLPPVTSPNWKALTTGKNPGKLGIFWWENVDTSNRKVYYPSHRKNANVEFFELIAREEPAGILGVPTTYPPKPVGEFVVSGAPDAEEDGFTHPSSLQGRLEDEFGYSVSFDGSLKHEPDEAASEIVDLIRLRFDVASELLEENDLSFLQVTTFYINSLHHYFWDDRRTLEGWRVVDEYVGDFLDQGYNVVLVSDHGSNRINTVFNVNTWLQEEGYLTLPGHTVENVFQRAGLTRDRLASLLQRFGLREFGKRMLPAVVRKRIPQKEGQLSRERESWFDWDETDVVATAQGPVYVNVEPDSKEYERLREELIGRIEDLTDPRGNPIAAEVHRGEDLYSGPYLDEAPDLVIEQASHVHIAGEAGRSSLFDDPKSNGWRGENERSGLFAACGPTFATGHLGEVSILDVAPSLLHLYDIDVPDDVDGRVQSELFARGSEPRERDITYSEVSRTVHEVRRIREVARSLEL